MPIDPIDAPAPRSPTSLTSDGSILTTLVRLAEANRLDVAAELYNEALDLANQSDLAGARARLQALLALTPSDGDAHLLLARVHVAAMQWRLALVELQEASACGTRVPTDLQGHVERNVQAETSWTEGKQAREHREDGELKKLRGDVRRLRSENAHLEADAREAIKEAKRWSWVALGSSVVAIVFIAARAVLPGADAPDVAVAAAPPAAAAAATVTDTPDAAPAVATPGTLGAIRNDDLATRANEALTAAGLGQGLKVIARGNSAQITGSAGSARQIKDAEKIVLGLAGVEKVSTESVVNTALRDGTSHVVASGDTLSRISVQYYGKESLHEKILAANPQLGPKGNLKVGASIVIPKVD